jgi:anti-anti-sigma regulatory factor
VRIPGYGIEVDPNTRTVWLHGEVDMASAPVLYAAAITLLTNPSADAVTIDLADVTWADSALPNTITAICDDINPTPTVRVINYDNRIKKLFLICDLGSYLDQIS